MLSNTIHCYHTAVSYTHTPRVMILIMEPISNPQCRNYIPAWRDRLLEVILLKLASTATVAGNYYTYVHSFMGRYFVSIDLLWKLAFALEEGITYDEEDPDLNIDIKQLFYNIAYGQKMESLFYAPHLKGPGKQITLFYSKFKIGIAV